MVAWYSVNIVYIFTVKLADFVFKRNIKGRSQELFRGTYTGHFLEWGRGEGACTSRKF